MKLWCIGAVGLSLAATGCADGSPDASRNEIRDTQTATPAAAVPASSPVVALGLTRDQLADADLVDSSGREIGEIERVVTDPSGTVTALLVDIEGTRPDRYVTIPLGGLIVLSEGGDRDLQTDLTREDLLAMPALAK